MMLVQPMTDVSQKVRTIYLHSSWHIWEAVPGTNILLQHRVPLTLAFLIPQFSLLSTIPKNTGPESDVKAGNRDNEGEPFYGGNG